MSDARTKRLNESQNPAINGGIADALHKIIIPQNTTDNLAEINPQEVGSIAFDTTQNKVVVSDGSGFQPVGSSAGASQTLDNLTSPTAINQDLIFSNDAVVQTASNPSADDSKTLTIQTGDADPGHRTGALTVKSGTSTRPGSVFVQAGDSSGAFGGGSLTLSSGSNSSTGNAGSIHITSGSANGHIPGDIISLTGDDGSGGRGSIRFNDGSEGTSGQVWTSIDNLGAGAWQAASSGGANQQLSNLSGTPIANLALTMPSPLVVTQQPGFACSYANFNNGTGTAYIGIDGAGLEALVPDKLLIDATGSGNSINLATDDQLRVIIDGSTMTSHVPMVFLGVADLIKGATGQPANFNSFSGSEAASMVSGTASIQVLEGGITLTSDAAPIGSIELLAANTELFGDSATFTSELHFWDIAEDKYVGFKAPDSVTTQVVWKLPVADAAVAGRPMVSDASGNLSFSVGASGSFTTVDNKTVTVVGGIITSIV